MNVTWIISSQVLNLVGTVIRKNVRCMCVWRLRNHKEVETLCEELSGIYDAKTIMQLYQHATEEPFSFLFVRLDAKTKRDMFWLRFEARLLPTEESDSSDVDGPGKLADGGVPVQPKRKPRPAAGAWTASASTRQTTISSRGRSKAAAATGCGRRSASFASRGS
jgi:hypothetical protein